jgi:hypothetical protein
MSCFSRLLNKVAKDAFNDALKSRGSFRMLSDDFVLAIPLVLMRIQTKKTLTAMSFACPNSWWRAQKMQMWEFLQMNE